MPKKAIFTMER